MACFNAGAISGFNEINSELNDGLVKALGFTGSRITFGGSSSITVCVGFSGSTGLIFECFDN